MTIDIGGEVWMDDFISVGAMVRWREGIGFQASYRHDAAALLLRPRCSTRLDQSKLWFL